MPAVHSAFCLTTTPSQAISLHNITHIDTRPVHLYHDTPTAYTTPIPCTPLQHRHNRSTSSPYLPEHAPGKYTYTANSTQPANLAVPVSAPRLLDRSPILHPYLDGKRSNIAPPSVICRSQLTPQESELTAIYGVFSQKSGLIYKYSAPQFPARDHKTYIIWRKDRKIDDRRKFIPIPTINYK